MDFYRKKFQDELELIFRLKVICKYRNVNEISSFVKMLSIFIDYIQNEPINYL
jgi:hypothetical protein